MKQGVTTDETLIQIKLCFWSYGFLLYLLHFTPRIMSIDSRSNNLDYWWSQWKTSFQNTLPIVNRTDTDRTRRNILKLADESLFNNCKFSTAHFLIQICSFIPKTTQLNIMVNSVSFFWWSKSPKGEAYVTLFFLVRQRILRIGWAFEFDVRGSQGKQNGKDGKFWTRSSNKERYIHTIFAWLFTHRALNIAYLSRIQDVCHR